MTNILIASDLHLSKNDIEYSINVLKEIVYLSKDKDALILLGDTFDTFEDVLNMKDFFSDVVSKLNIPIFLLKGNHELLLSKGSKLSHIKFSDNTFVIDEDSVSFFIIKDIEIFAMPYQESIDLSKIETVEKNSKARLFIAHGIVSGTFWQIEEGESLAVITSEIIKKLNPDISLIGHIHKKMTTFIDGFEIVYTGSSRVVRKSSSEIGKKYVLSIKHENSSIEKEWIEIKSAGEYRVYSFLVDNNLEETIKNTALGWNKEDIIEINLGGVVEDENEIESLKNKIYEKYYKYVREFIIKNSSVILLSDSENENIIKDFLSVIKSYEDDTDDEEEKEIASLARSIGLEKIVASIKKKK